MSILAIVQETANIVILIANQEQKCLGDITRLVESDSNKTVTTNPDRKTDFSAATGRAGHQPRAQERQDHDEPRVQATGQMD